jgi:hypothetical protein
MFPVSWVHRLAPIVLSGLLLVAAGCGSRTYPVTGKVVWEDGTPATELAGWGVHFSSFEMQVGAEAEIASDATFRAKLYRESGLPAGEYQVVVAPPGDDASRINPKFLRYETSGLKATVEPKDNDFTFKVERAKRP